MTAWPSVTGNNRNTFQGVVPSWYCYHIVIDIASGTWIITYNAWHQRVIRPSRCSHANSRWRSGNRFFRNNRSKSTREFLGSVEVFGGVQILEQTVSLT
jgi:hypothetical protein